MLVADFSVQINHLRQLGRRRRRRRELWARAANAARRAGGARGRLLRRQLDPVAQFASNSLARDLREVEEAARID